jgi:hypothetical protein
MTGSVLTPRCRCRVLAPAPRPDTVLVAGRDGVYREAAHVTLRLRILDSSWAAPATGRVAFLQIYDRGWPVERLMLITGAGDPAQWSQANWNRVHRAAAALAAVDPDDLTVLVTYQSCPDPQCARFLHDGAPMRVYYPDLPLFPSFSQESFVNRYRYGLVVHDLQGCHHLPPFISGL